MTHAAPQDAVASSGAVARRGAWVILDQSLSSATNFALSLLALHATGAEGFGSFTIVIGLYFLVLNFARAISGEPQLVRGSFVDRGVWRRDTSQSVGVALLIGIGGAIAAALASAFTGGLSGVLLAMGVVFPGLIMQDAWRYAFFADGRPKSAFVNDSVWAVAQFGFLGALFVFGHFTLVSLILAWGAAAAVAATWGIAQARVVPSPSRLRPWLRSHIDLWPRFAAESLLVSGTSQMMFVAIGAVVGLKAVGALNGARVAMGPFNIVALGAMGFGVPEGVRIWKRHPDRLVPAIRGLAAGLGVAAIICAATVYLLPLTIGVRLFGSTWREARAVIPFAAIWVAATNIAQAARVGLRVLAAARESLRTWWWSAPATFIGGLGGAYLGGAVGAGAGLAVSQCAVGVLWWTRFTSAVSATADRPAEVDGLVGARNNSTELPAVSDHRIRSSPTFLQRNGHNRSALVDNLLFVLVSVAAGVFSVIVVGWFNTATIGSLVKLTLALMVVPLLFSIRVSIRRDWFHPFGFPLLYLAGVTLTPLLYILMTQDHIGSIREADLSPRTIMVTCSTLLGLISGAALGLAVGTVKGRRAFEDCLSRQKLRRFARAALAVSVAGQLPRALGAISGTYGAGSVEFGLLHAIQSFVGSLFMAGVVLMVISHLAHAPDRRPILGTTTEYAMCVLFGLLTLLSGTRGELLGPIIFFAWAFHTYVRPIPFTQVVACTLLLVVTFLAVGSLRVKGGPNGAKFSAVERVLGDISSPILVTAQVVRYVPRVEKYTAGSTYIASLMRQLPGPVAVAVFGPPDDTGSFVLRRISGVDNPNAGLAFSFSAEGYLNFGVKGALAVSCLAGVALGLSYCFMGTGLARARSYMYPVMVGSIPLGFRSDALGELKLILYPLLLVAAALHFSRTGLAKGSFAPETKMSNGRERKAMAYERIR